MNANVGTQDEVSISAVGQEAHRHTHTRACARANKNTQAAPDTRSLAHAHTRTGDPVLSDRPASGRAFLKHTHNHITS